MTSQIQTDGEGRSFLLWHAEKYFILTTWINGRLTQAYLWVYKKWLALTVPPLMIIWIRYSQSKEKTLSWSTCWTWNWLRLEIKLELLRLLTANHVDSWRSTVEMTSSGTYICHESSVKLRLPWTCGYQRLGVPVEASRAQTVMIAVVSMSELLPIVVQVMLTSTFWRSAVARHPSYGELRWKPVVTNARQSRSESRTEKNWCQGHAKRKRLVSARSAPLRSAPCGHFNRRQRGV